MADELFIHRIRPRYSEVDMQGVVFNAHWLTYFDDAMTRFFDALGFDTRETFLGEWDAMVVKAQLDWRGSAGWEDEVAIGVAPSRLGTASFDIAFDAQVGGGTVCAAVITYVSIARSTKQSMPLPDPIRAALERRLVDLG